MATVRGGPVLPHVQAFADAVVEACDLAPDNPGTYPGHHPHQRQALDIFTPTSSRTLGDKVCAFALAHWDEYGLDYIIYRRAIWNPEIARKWRPMEDRRTPTANHEDHVHVSFLATAPAVSLAPPASEEDDMTIPMTIAWLEGQAWIVTGSIRTHIGPDELERAKTAGVPEIPGESTWLRGIPEGVAV